MSLLLLLPEPLLLNMEQVEDLARGELPGPKSEQETLLVEPWRAPELAVAEMPMEAD